jgi:hypothetical protein
VPGLKLIREMYYDSEISIVFPILIPQYHIRMNQILSYPATISYLTLHNIRNWFDVVKYPNRKIKLKMYTGQRKIHLHFRIAHVTNWLRKVVGFEIPVWCPFLPKLLTELVREVCVFLCNKSISRLIGLLSFQLKLGKQGNSIVWTRYYYWAR